MEAREPAVRARLSGRPRWRDADVLAAITRALALEHCGRVGGLDRAKLARALQPVHARLARGIADPFALAAAYAAGIARERPLKHGTLSLALAAVYVSLRLSGLVLEAPEEDAVATVRALDAGTLGEDELASWLRAACAAAGPAPFTSGKPASPSSG